MFREAAIVFGLFLLSAAALSGALMLSRRARLEIERRLSLVAAHIARPADAMGTWLSSRTSRLDTQARRVFAVGVQATWGMRSGAALLIVTFVIVSMAAWLISHVVFSLPNWLALPAAAALAFYVPRSLLLRQQRKADRQFTDLFPDAVDAIARMLRAGLPISSAVRAVSTEAAPPVNSVFRMVADQMSIGTPIEEALDASSRHVGLPDFRFFTVAVVLQHTTGGNLAATLEILSDIVRKRRAVRLKARATTSEIRVSAYVLGALPLFIVAGLLVLQPGYLSPLFIDPRGHVILALAAGCLVAAALTMRQMMRSVTNL
ncbi:MAG TPA: type II secretion system F family protein [Pseudolabrys sp.]|nr:type II secretion system F family protein [Pseudolabrys sp.]